MTKPQFTQALRSWVDISTQRSMRSWAHHAKSVGLSMPQFSIMMQLYKRGACGISQISENFEVTNAAASQLVDKLVQSGLIERTEDPKDRRAKHIQLSAKGRALIEKGIRGRYHWLDQLAENLSEKERAQTAEALKVLTEAVLKLDQSQ
jgi:DNA-binding MarR family transcriptional regulator